jgi:diguanylate cyclase (GGDEF)-like protein
VYDERLASEILNALNSAYPDRLGLGELQTALPQFAVADEEWLRAIAALEGEGKITGKFLRTGVGDALQAAALIQITSLGRQFINSSPPESRPARLDARLHIPDAGEFDRDLPGHCREANAENPLSLVIVDIDHFKAVNDTYGHLVGDEVLKQVAGTLKAGCKGKGKVYRYGGDELTILLPNYTLPEAEVLAERLRNQIAQARKNPPAITPSIGVATFPDPISSANDLFKAADDALYSAKTGGRNQVRTAAGKAAVQQTIRLTQQALSVYMRSDDRVRRLDEGIASHSGQLFVPAEDASLAVFDKAKQLGIATIGELQDLVRKHGDLSQKLARCMVPITPVHSGQSLHYILDIAAAQRGIEGLRTYFRSLRYSNTAEEYAAEFMETLKLLPS